MPGSRVEVVTEDRQAQSAHVESQLVCPTSARAQQIPAQLPAMFEQLDTCLTVRLPRGLVSGVHPVLLDNAVAHGAWQGHRRVVGGDRLVRSGHASVAEQVL